MKRRRGEEGRKGKSRKSTEEGSMDGHVAVHPVDVGVSTKSLHYLRALER